MAQESVSVINNREERRLTTSISAKRVISGESIGSTAVVVPSQDLSLAPLSFTTSETANFTVDYVYFDFSVPITETLSVTRTDPAIDELLESVSLSGANNARLVHNQNVFIDVENGQQFQIDVTDISGVGIVDVVLKISGV